MAEITKNVFTEGMVLDLAPSGTSQTFLTDALNATFITNNGNELSLLNDLGNAKVQNVTLPQGYSPVGTCEYGNVIYVLSVNQKTGRSQIGSFPSPEYVINSKESTKPLEFTEYDFFDTFQFRGHHFHTNGEMFSESKEQDIIDGKINDITLYNESLHESKFVTLTKKFADEYNNLDAGDSYAIEITESAEDYIDKSKIVLLKSDGTLQELIGECDGSYYYLSSKLSGSLAINTTLKQVTNYTLSYDFDELSDSDKAKIKNSVSGYKLKLATNCKLVNNNNREKDLILFQNIISGEQYTLETFDRYLQTCFGTNESLIESIPNDSTITYEIIIPQASENFIQLLNIVAFPWMSWGILKQESASLNLDISKVNSNSYTINTWKYYTYDTTTILNVNLEFYPKINYDVSKVVFNFYDDESQVAKYTIEGQEYYSGDFELELPLNGVYSVPELKTPDNVDAHTGDCLYKIDTSNNTNNINLLPVDGLKISALYITGDQAIPVIIYFKNKEFVIVDNDGKTYLLLDDITIYSNDIGTLRTNSLYGVIIEVYTERTLSEKEKANNVDSNESISELFYKWIWTTTMYNDYYYDESVTDVSTLPIQLVAEPLATFNVKSTKNLATYDNEASTTLGIAGTSELATEEVTYVSTATNTVKMTENTVILNVDYGCFSLDTSHFTNSFYVGNTTLDEETDPNVISQDSMDINITLSTPKSTCDVSGYTITNQIEYVDVNEAKATTNKMFTVDTITTVINYYTYCNNQQFYANNNLIILKPLFSYDDIKTELKKKDAQNILGIKTNGEFIEHVGFFCGTMGLTDSRHKHVTIGSPSMIGKGYSWDNNQLAYRLERGSAPRGQSNYGSQGSWGGAGNFGNVNEYWNRDNCNTNVNGKAWFTHLFGTMTILPTMYESLAGLSVDNRKFGDNIRGDGTKIWDIDTVLYRHVKSELSYRFVTMLDHSGYLHITNTMWPGWTNSINQQEKIVGRNLLSMLMQIYKIQDSTLTEKITRTIYHAEDTRYYTQEIIAKSNVSEFGKTASESELNLKYNNDSLANYINTVNTKMFGKKTTLTYDPIINILECSKLYPVKHTIVSNTPPYVDPSTNNAVIYPVYEQDAISCLCSGDSSKYYQFVNGLCTEVTQELSFYSLDLPENIKNGLVLIKDSTIDKNTISLPSKCGVEHTELTNTLQSTFNSKVNSLPSSSLITSSWNANYSTNNSRQSVPGGYYDLWVYGKEEILSSDYFAKIFQQGKSSLILDNDYNSNNNYFSIVTDIECGTGGASHVYISNSSNGGFAAGSWCDIDEDECLISKYSYINYL